MLQKIILGTKPLFSLPANKSITLLTGQAGSGKSILLAEIATQLLVGGHKVILLTHGNLNGNPFGLAPDLAADAFRQLKMRYDASNFTVLDNDCMSKNLSELEINDAVLLIDDLEFYIEKYGQSDMQELIRRVRHAFIASQYMESFLLIDANASFRAIFLQNFRYINNNPSVMQSIVEFSLASGLLDAINNIRSGHDFREFIYLNDGGFELIHFKLSSGSIMSFLNT